MGVIVTLGFLVFQLRQNTRALKSDGFYHVAQMIHHPTTLIIEDAEIADTLRALDRLITEAMPGRRRVLYEGTFWGGTEQEIIGYGHIVQSRQKGEDVHWFLVGLARQKDHYSLYVNAVDGGKYLGQQIEGQLGKVKLGSASIGFKALDDLDVAVLEELMRRAHEITEPDPQ